MQGSCSNSLYNVKKQLKSHITMDVTKKLLIQSETVEKIYDYYIDEKLLVNRRYQRKLVWTLEEKEKFIDSIALNYPVPLFLVAEVKYMEKNRYEIIDGMQRLDAIVSFIEGDFPLNGKYFDLETIANTKYLLDKKNLKQNHPKLDRELCKDIASYPLPLSVSIFEDEDVVDIIFKRINSNGKHLSQQELRQAGSDTRFAYIVRKLAESIRGDVSLGDKLLLGNMKKISINNNKLKYGIDMGGIFWRKHNIITNENIRQSRDEELTAHILCSLLMEPRPSATSSNLNGFYGLENGENRILEDKIRKYGEQYCINIFESVFDEIRKTLDASGKSFHKILFKKDTSYLNRSFHVVFLAYYDLLIKDELKITNYLKLAEKLDGVGDQILTPNIETLNLSKPRDIAVNAIKGIIKDFMTKRDSNDPAFNNGVMKLENILSCSNTENTNYDFKIGIHRLHGNNDFDKEALNKILKTLSAIANLGKGSVGYIILGVADDVEDSRRHEKIYSSKSRKYKKFYVTGVNREVSKYKSDEEYRRLIENTIRNSDISPSIYKDQILRNIDYFNYYDKSILILKIQAEKEPCKFGQNYHERLGTQTVEIPEDKVINLWKRFLS